MQERNVLIILSLYRIGDISREDNISLLGVNIDFMLQFDDHVSDICKKASKQLAVLKRFRRFLTKQGKLVIYNSFIASNFSYCPLAWHFCSVTSTNKLEKVQERALRFINNDFTSSLNEFLNLQILSRCMLEDSNLWHVKYTQL